MPDASESIQSIDDICLYVAKTLAALEMRIADPRQLDQRVLYRNGTPCGVYFYLQGPRVISPSAIWETDGNNILFYGSCGERLHRTKLVNMSPIA